MTQPQSDSREPKKSGTDDTYLPDMTPRREGGDDSLAEASPYDYRNDEKVLVNKQKETKMVNHPSHTTDNTSKESNSNEGAP